MSDAALKALLDYRQADEDGVMVITSRQAIHEVADQVGALKSALAKQMADNICETVTLAGAEDNVAALEAEIERLRIQWAGMKSEVQVCHEKIKRTHEALEQCAEYFEPLVDVNWEGDGPNRAGRLLNEINFALGKTP